MYHDKEVVVKEDRNRFYSVTGLQILFNMAILDAISIFFQPQFGAFINRCTTAIISLFNISNPDGRLKDVNGFFSQFVRIFRISNGTTVFSSLQFLVLLIVYFVVASIICHMFISLFKSKLFIKVNTIIGGILIIRLIFLFVMRYV